MREEVDRLGGFREANITGFGKGEVAKGIYGLITFIGATETLYNNIISMLLVNDSDATIAKKHTTYPTWILPESIIRMIPLHDLPDRGPSLPPEESPATPIWAKIVNTIMEVGRTLWNLFVAGVSFIAELLEKVAEWGLELLGKIMDYIEQVAKMFSFVLKIIAEIIGYFFRMLVWSVKAVLGCFVSFQNLDCGFIIDISLGFISVDLSLYVAYMDPGFGFEIPFLITMICIQLYASSLSVLNISFSVQLSSLHLGTNVDFNINVVDLLEPSYRVMNLNVPEFVVNLFEREEFWEAFGSTFVTQMFAEFSFISSMEASILMIAMNHIFLGLATYSFGSGVLAWSYLSGPSEDQYIECIGFAIASIWPLIFGIIETLELFDKIRDATDVASKANLPTFWEYAKEIKLAREFERRLRGAFSIYIGSTLMSIIVGCLITQMGYSAPSFLPDLVLFILEKILVYAIKKGVISQYVLWYFCLGVKEFEKVFVGAILYFGTLSTVRKYAKVETILSAIIHGGLLFIICARLLNAFSRYASCYNDAT